jgi:hypothetical protein
MDTLSLILVACNSAGTALPVLLTGPSMGRTCLPVPYYSTVRYCTVVGKHGTVRVRTVKYYRTVRVRTRAVLYGLACTAVVPWP